ncbi:hypothetical protein [Arthrobacter sp. N1]|uniref:hypothetical protein n=1 Tax=Arthrobacter sp. N1 TaxID=619291 RepID=UPI003BAE4007
MIAVRRLAGVRNEDGAVEVGSFVVGAILLGIVSVGIVIAATSVVPYTQDNAARSDLSALASAQSIAHAKDGTYFSSEDLAGRGYVSGEGRVAAGVPQGAGCFVAVSGSKTGRTFVATDRAQAQDTNPAVDTSCLTREAYSLLRARVSAPVIAQDSFDRSESGTWGLADVAGRWTQPDFYAPRLSVAAGAGRISNEAGHSIRMSLPTQSVPSATVKTEFSVSKVPNAGGFTLFVIGRKAGTADYRAKVFVSPSGAVALDLLKKVGNVETRYTGRAIGGISYRAGDRLNLRLEVKGNSPTTISGKLWKAGQPEPRAWQMTAKDRSSGLQGAGVAGIESYLSAATTNGPIELALHEYEVRLA